MNPLSMPHEKAVKEKQETVFSVPEHGGDIHWASAQFNIPQEQWLDLSTGISPWSWPVPNIPEYIWQKLPQSDETLRRVAAHYYCKEITFPELSSPDLSPENILTIPGSQFAIASLPSVFGNTAKHVAIPYLGYKEHQKAWEKAGHILHIYRTKEELNALVESAKVSVAIVINPNNPSGEWLELTQLQHIQQQLEIHYPGQSLLVVDEAFADTSPAQSLTSACAHSLPKNLIILRSVGKFFGLAGIRLGFMIAHTSWLAKCRHAMPLWSVSHPAQYIGERALADKPWVDLQNRRIREQSNTMCNLLEARFIASKELKKLSQTPLFITLQGKTETCRKIFHFFARHGILVRYGEDTRSEIHSSNTSCANAHYSTCSAWLRFGLPGEGIERFIQVLNDYQ